MKSAGWVTVVGALALAACDGPPERRRAEMLRYVGPELHVISCYETDGEWLRDCSASVEVAGRYVTVSNGFLFCHEIDGKVREVEFTTGRQLCSPEKDICRPIVRDEPAK